MDRIKIQIKVIHYLTYITSLSFLFIWVLSFILEIKFYYTYKWLFPKRIWYFFFDFCYNDDIILLIFLCLLFFISLLISILLFLSLFLWFTVLRALILPIFSLSLRLFIVINNLLSFSLWLALLLWFCNRIWLGNTLFFYLIFSFALFLRYLLFFLIFQSIFFRPSLIFLYILLFELEFLLLFLLISFDTSFFLTIPCNFYPFNLTLMKIRNISSHSYLDLVRNKQRLYSSTPTFMSFFWNKNTSLYLFLLFLDCPLFFFIISWFLFFLLHTIKYKI